VTSCCVTVLHLDPLGKLTVPPPDTLAELGEGKETERMRTKGCREEQMRKRREREGEGKKGQGGRGEGKGPHPPDKSLRSDTGRQIYKADVMT